MLKSIDTISHSETILIGKYYMHQQNNPRFMTKNVNFSFYQWAPLGYKKNTDLAYLIKCY